jgi:transposase InsO family protein
MELKREWDAGSEASPPNYAGNWAEIVRLLCANATRVIIDPSKELRVACDSSNAGVGITLYQFHDGKKYYAAVITLRFTGSQLRWSIQTREAYGLLAAVRRFKNYFMFMKVVVEFDHLNLAYDTQDSLALQRVRAELSMVPALRFAPRVHRPGHSPEMQLPDFASRWLLPDTPFAAVDTEGGGAGGVGVVSRATRPARFRLDPSLHAGIPPAAGATRAPAARLEAAKPVGNPHKSVLTKWAERIVAAQRALGDALLERNPAYEKKKVDDRDVLYKSGRVVVPNPPPPEDIHLVHDLLKAIHDPLHDSVGACVERLKAVGVYLENALEAVKDYVGSCVCQYARGPTEPRRVGPLLIPVRYKPWEAVMADWIPLEPSDAGHTAIFIMMDLATRYCWASAVDTADSAEAARQLDRWRAAFGAPELFLSDGGTTICKGEVPKWCARHNVRLDVGTPHNSKGRGAVESMVGRVKRALRALLPPREDGNTPRNWDVLLPGLQFCMNNIPMQERGGFTAAQLALVGPRSPAELLGTMPVARSEEHDLFELINATVAARQWAALSLGVRGVYAKAKYDTALEVYNPSTGDANPSVGEWLLVFRPDSGLGHHWHGPFKVLNVEAVGGRPTGFITIAEVLGGIEPGEPGYPRTGKPMETHIDRTWPFDASRLTATFLHQRKLPMGWGILRRIISGPTAAGSQHGEGRFHVEWATRAQTWEPAAALAHSVVFQEFCEKNHLSAEGKPRKGKGGAPKRN